MDLNSSVKELILSGLTQKVLKEEIVFAVFLFLYLATRFANLLIVMTIRYSQMLVSPMYCFLLYLSFADTCLSTTTTARLIINVVSEKKVIFYNECMTQIFAFQFFACMEIFVLVLMSLDHYVAICKSLRYTTIMSGRVCGMFVNLAWVGSCILSLAQIFLALKLPFCGPNVIDHYYCDMQSLLTHACMDTYITNLLIVFNSGAIMSFIIQIIYVLKLHSLRNQSVEGRKKALTNCTTHIIVVTLFFVPCLFTYARPPTTFSVVKMVAEFYSTGIPLLNPLSYTLRNSEVKNAMRKVWCNQL